LLTPVVVLPFPVGVTFVRVSWLWLRCCTWLWFRRRFSISLVRFAFVGTVEHFRASNTGVAGVVIPELYHLGWGVTPRYARSQGPPGRDFTTLLSSEIAAIAGVGTKTHFPHVVPHVFHHPPRDFVALALVPPLLFGLVGAAPRLTRGHIRLVNERTTASAN